MSRLRHLAATLAVAFLASSCTVWTWGSVNASSVPVEGSDDWRAVSVGVLHTCRIDTTNSLFCDGEHDPDFDHTASDLPPRGEFERVGDADWLSVDSGPGTICGIKVDRSLWCWGYNATGAVGDGTTNYRIDPVRIGTNETWREVAVGTLHACAITMSDTLWCWGEGERFPTGLASAERQLTPAQVGTERWSTVAAGDTHSCAVAVTGTLWCWGYDLYRLDGFAGGNTEAYPTPTQVGSDDGWAVLDANGLSTCATRTDGTLWCGGPFGADGSGPRFPTQVGTASNWTQASVGLSEACGIRSDLTLWCWGRNRQGQVGDGTTEHRDLPVQIGPDQHWFAVDVGWTTTESIGVPRSSSTND